jgi:hypothetical protein
MKTVQEESREIQIYGSRSIFSGGTSFRGKWKNWGKFREKYFEVLIHHKRGILLQL